MSAELDRAFEALADPTRRRMVQLLGEAPRRSGELAELLTLTRPTASKHLAALREAGVVAEEGDPSDARARVYRLRPRPFRALRGWLDEVEAFWSEQLDAFKAHAEAKHRGSRGGSRSR